MSSTAAMFKGWRKASVWKIQETMIDKLLHMKPIKSFRFSSCQGEKFGGHPMLPLSSKKFLFKKQLVEHLDV
jgi:hypothetical protein